MGVGGRAGGCPLARHRTSGLVHVRPSLVRPPVPELEWCKDQTTVSPTSALRFLPREQDNPHDTAPLDPSLLDVPYSARHAPGAPYLAPANTFLHANGQPSWQLLHFLR